MMNARVEPIGINIQIKKTETIHEALIKAGVFIEKPCGGMGVCGECTVFVDPPKNVLSTPHENISQKDDARGVRMACQAIPKGDICIRLTDNFLYENEVDNRQGKIIVQNNQLNCAPFDPGVKLKYENSIAKLWHDRARAPVIIDNWKEKYKPKGLAIDIGTTTMAICLVCLETGKILATKACLNPQMTHGHDVLSRIQYAKNRQRREEMANLVKDKLNSLLSDICKTLQTWPEEIVDVVIGANTSMLQLAAGMDCTSIGKSPFNFDIQGGRIHWATIFGLNVNKGAKVYLPPIMHAFVGTDISAGLVLCPDFFNTAKIVLFIDMGTNGEICLNVKGKWYATSTAAGPAFEGMGLSSGMRAMDGAVDRVDYHDGNFTFHTIGNKKIKGICGSGIIDLMAKLLESGYMDASGRLVKKESQDSYIFDIDGVTAFQYGNGVFFTQKDIRQIQLAKSAIQTGIQLILQHGCVKNNQIDRVYLAGGFGAYLRVDHMRETGLLDEQIAEKTIACGNTSLGGSIVLLTNGGQRDFLENALDQMTYLSLAKESSFMDSFLSNLNFPSQKKLRT
jgi:uncharacterized 2Fe-2S/4Fe-4S cluster protein (DUF4445 family)